MKQVVLSYKTGELTLEEVPAPLCKAGGVVIQTRCSLISAGTERSLIELGRKSLVGKAMARPDLVQRVVDKARKEGIVATFNVAMGRLDTPTPLGYSSAGEVVEVGSGVTGFQVGDRVACIGAGLATHSELAWVPKNLCAHLPPEVSDEEGAYGMVAIIALHGVRCAEPQLGHRVVVLGLGLLGQLAVQELAAAGAEVFGIDLDPAKVALARELGASAGCAAGDEAALRVLEFTGGAGADAVVITAATKDDSAVRLATECAAKGARIVLVGTADIQLDRQLFWEKELRFLVSRASGPGALDASYELQGHDYPAEYVRWTEGRNLRAFLELVRRRRVDVGKLTTHRFPIERAMEAFALVEGGGQPFIGVVLTYPAAPARARTLAVGPAASGKAPGRSGDLGVALVGAGLFARAQLLPALKKVSGLRTVTLAATSGVNASHFAKKYGFQKATTEWRDVLHDAEVDAVFVLTRHDAHAAMVEEALAAGKHVFVEKPLCMTEEELQRIAKAHAKAQAEHGLRHLLVGYNRRFSPLLAECKQFLGERRAPATVLLRVNAGAVPADHWAHQAAEGGGRILSEVCHFFDLAMALTGEGCSRVYARAATSSGGLNLGDEAAVLLTMDRGSIVQIVYTGAGDRSFSRERVEVFSGGAALSIDDWRKAELCRNNHRKTVSRFNADLGHEAELEAFLGGIARGVPAVPFDVLAGSTLATLRALKSLETGAAEPCAWEPAA